MADSIPPEADDPTVDIRAMEALAACRNYPGAAEKARRLLARHPDHATAHYLLGLYLYNSGRRADALQACRAALALAPADARAHRIYGIVLGTAVPNRAAAFEHLCEAVRLEPVDGYNHFFLGRALAEIGATAEALANCRTACEKAPAEAYILASTALFLFASYRLAEAKDLAMRALALDPEHHVALAAAAKARLIDGEVADARDLAAAAVARDATYRPALEVLVEADMCRRRIFWVHSRFHSWCLGSRRRERFVAIAAFYLAIGALVAVATWSPGLAGLLFYPVMALLFSGSLPRRIHRRRVAAALKPVRLDKRF